MPELIDREALLQDMTARFGGIADWHYFDCVNEQPTIDAKPIRHGRWILCEDQHGVDNDNNNYAYFCSQCHYQDVHSKYANVNFCWNCGADMREEGADNG